jgi:cytochrome c-type biogenesis protein CcmE
MRNRYIRFGVVIVVLLVSLGYLAWTGVNESKSYYVTIKELQTMDGRYSKRLRVAGNVVPGSMLPVVYTGTDAPPDTFKDDSQALAEGTFGQDHVFHAKQLQAKCASKYAPAPGQAQPTAAPMKTSQNMSAPASAGSY